MVAVLDEQLDLDAQPAPTHRDAAAAWVATPAPGRWSDRAACAGMDTAAFVDRADAATVAHARAVCHRCPVEDACADYALRSRAWGVWGGELRRAGKVQPRAS
jgi:WhiB family redox-sensing transcriptional regulator